MKYFIINFFLSFSIGVGYAEDGNLLSSVDKTNTKECSIFELTQDCLFETNDDHCMEIIPLISFVGTRHEYVVDAFIVDPTSLLANVEGISEKEMEQYSLDFFENHKDFLKGLESNENPRVNGLIDLKRKYSCD